MIGTAPVNRVIPISTVDGPGARTAIFLQGCNIACVYCHNPETQCLCNGCGACVSVCPAGALQLQNSGICWNSGACVQCDACLATCPSYASPKIRWLTPAEALDEAARNIPFIRGITVSGGECTLYPEWLTELFRLAKQKGLTCLIDTNGMVDFAEYPDLLDVCDGVMLDVKAWQPDVYKALVQSCTDNANVKKNLALLARLNKLEELRIVYLPGMVDTKAILEGMAKILEGNAMGTRLKLIAFRPNGVKGTFTSATAPSPAEMQALLHVATVAGFTNAVVV